MSTAHVEPDAVAWLHELPHHALRVARVGTAGHAPVRVERWRAQGEALVALLAARSDGSRGPGLLAVGPAGDVARIISQWEPCQVDHASLTRGTLALCPPGTAEAWGWHHVSLWDWLYAPGPPPEVPRDHSVVPAPWGSPVRAHVAALLKEANPTTDRNPDQDGDEWWVACDSTGEVVACAAAQIGQGDVHFAAVATAPRARRRGWAQAVVAHMTREYYARGFVAVTLGMWADNDAARRLYQSLGFQVAHAVETWRPAARP